MQVRHTSIDVLDNPFWDFNRNWNSFSSQKNLCRSVQASQLCAAMLEILSDAGHHGEVQHEDLLNVVSKVLLCLLHDS